MKPGKTYLPRLLRDDDKRFYHFLPIFTKQKNEKLIKRLTKKI